MIFKCQQSCKSKLDMYVHSDPRTLLISGPEGCGKTYLAKQFAESSDSTFISVPPVVDEVRNAVENCSKYTEKLTVVIENLDEGDVKASYALLKFIEEPRSNVCVIITCRMISKIPDTIISRSVCLTVNSPTQEDLDAFCSSTDPVAYARCKSYKLWKTVKAFKDAVEVFGMPDSHIQYYEEYVPSLLNFKGSVSDIAWKLGHISDGGESDLKYVLRIALSLCRTKYMKEMCIAAISDIQASRISKHAILSKLAFEGKYGTEPSL